MIVQFDELKLYFVFFSQAIQGSGSWHAEERVIHRRSAQRW
ncbi:MAG: hypothetical protein AAGC60_19300 [Acidobacteriota bacterium]